MLRRFKKFTFWAVVSTFLLLSTTILPVYSAGNGELSISARVTKETYDAGELVRIDGSVTDEAGNPVANALISIQVDDPSGDILHLGAAFSNGEGAFSHEFRIPYDAEAGTYAIHLTASKQGYSDSSTQISCLVVAEFEGLLAAFLALTILLLFLSAARKRGPGGGPNLHPH